MLIAATCSTIAAMLAYASGGDTITLHGRCDTITIRQKYESTVTVDASKALVRGLVINGENIHWKGGVLTASGGLNANGPTGYAVRVFYGKSVTIEGALITDASRGVVLDRSEDINIIKNRFNGLRVDGIIASRVAGMKVTWNDFRNSKPNPSTCVSSDGQTAFEVARRSCEGAWRDGDHADAVQMRNGISDALIAFNRVTGQTQGLTQMDSVNDAPLKNVVIRKNAIATDGYHRLTLTRCYDCRIEGNYVRRQKGSTKKAVILEGMATRCGNFVEDERSRDPRCPS